MLPRIAAELDDLSIVQGLDDQDRRLASVLSIRELDRGEALFRQGAPADALFVLLEGVVEIRADDGTPVARANAEETVGERAMLPGSPHSASSRLALRPGEMGEHRGRTRSRVGRSRHAARRSLLLRNSRPLSR